MAKSKPNQIRYNAKISGIRKEINKEKEEFIEGVRTDIQHLLERRSPSDLGDLKKSWIVRITNKDKLHGRSLADLTKVRTVTLGISVESTSRHAIMQMFGWNAVEGQLLTGYRYGKKWRILRASRPLFKRDTSVKPKKRKPQKGRIKSFVTRGGKHAPDKNLAFEGGAHSIKTEIKRIVAVRLKKCKYLGRIIFISENVATVWTGNKTVGRIAKWMAGTLTTELNSRATVSAEDIAAKKKR